MSRVAAPSPLSDSLDYVKAPLQDQHSDNSQVAGLVAAVLNDVRQRGDAAVREYALKFDSSELERFEVTKAERQHAVAMLDPQTRADTEFAIENVRCFAKAQLSTIGSLEIEPMPGLHLGHRVIPIQRVGAYVPGGRFPLLSAPIMTDRKSVV